MCDRILPYVTKLYIDEQKMYSLSKFSTKKIVHSDHNSLIGYVNLKIQRNVPERRTIFDFKNEEGMAKFRQMTTYTQAFTGSFKKDFLYLVKYKNGIKI